MDKNLWRPEKLQRQHAIVISCLYWAFLVIGFILCYKYLLPAVFPFVISFLLAWLFNGTVTWCQKKLRVPRVLTASALVLLLAGAIIGIVVLLGTTIVSGAKSILEIMPHIFDRIILPSISYFSDWLEQLITQINPNIGLTLETTFDSIFKLISTGVTELSTKVLAILGDTISSLPPLLMNSLITIIATIFISTDFDTIQRFLMRLLSTKAKVILIEFKDYFGGTVLKCLWSYALILFITFSELCLGFILIRVPNGAVLAFFIAVLDILPVLGTGTILIPWAILSMVQGNIVFGIKLIVLYVTITVIRNIIEPRLVGRQIQLHPVMTFITMLTGLKLFGVVGLFGLPLLCAFLRQLHNKGIVHIHILGDEQS